MFDTTQPNWEELLSLVEKGDQHIVPFIGAGLSLYGATDRRLPSWWNLVNSIFEYGRKSGLLDDPNTSNQIRSLIDSGNLIEALDSLNQELGESIFIDSIEKLLSIEGREIPPAILELVCISWSLIVTTNLDRFIESAWSKEHQRPIIVLTNKDTDRLSKVFLGQYQDQDSVLAKIHGTVERYDSWVLTTKQYTWLLDNNEPYVQLLKSLFLRSILFLGYGLEDGDFDLIFKQLRQIFPGGGGKSYAIVPGNVERKNEFIHKAKLYGLKLIFYEVDKSKKDHKDGGHAEVLECLQILVEKWRESFGDRTSFIKLLYFPALDSDFVGRDKESELVSDFLFRNNEKGVQIIGFGGEGKTSFIQNFLYKNRKAIINHGYDSIFGFCFYKNDTGRFINDFASFLGATSIEEESLETKTQKIVNRLKTGRKIIVLDGFEVVQNSKGALLNRMVERVLEGLYSSENFILITTRIELKNSPIRRVFIGPLSDMDTREVLRTWGILKPDPKIMKWVSLEAGRHALSLRVLAAFISKQSESAIQGLEKLSLSEIPDESDPLKANKAYRLLEYYEEFLSEIHIAFLNCFSLFRRPIQLGLILECFPKASTTSDISFPLKNKELRPHIRDLLERRLLISESGTHLTAHPNVKDFFNEKAIKKDSKSFHRRVVAFLQQYLIESLPQTYGHIQEFMELCFHSAKAEQWDIFHEVFFHTINRGFRNYLGNNLGAWEEFLNLATLTFPEGDWKETPVINPTYYRATVSRCNKHLGRSEISVQEYVRTLKLCAKYKDPETAKYTNNFLTLAMLMGKFDLVDKLIPMNFGTLQWIQEDWKYYWQLEHALFPIGHYAGLRGDFHTAEQYIDAAHHAWDKYPGKREWIFDFDRVYHSDIIIANDLSRIVEAESVAYNNLNLGKRMEWQETIARAKRSIASICRVASRKNHDRLHIAREQLDSCADIVGKHFIPAMQIEVWIEIIRFELEILFNLSDKLNIRNLELRIKKTEEIILSTKLFQFLPEIKAAWALWYHLDGKEGFARENAYEGYEVAKRQGNLFAILDPASNFFHLQKLFNFDKIVQPEAIIDPVNEYLEHEMNASDFLHNLEDIESSLNSY